MPPVRLSRYEFSKVFKDKCGFLFVTVPEPVARKQFSDDLFVIAGEGDSVFSISAKIYKSMLDPQTDIRPSGFYWVVAQANKIINPMAKLKKGSKIRIPSIDALETNILVPPPNFETNELI